MEQNPNCRVRGNSHCVKQCWGDFSGRCPGLFPPHFKPVYRTDLLKGSTLEFTLDLHTKALNGSRELGYQLSRTGMLLVQICLQ